MAWERSFLATFKKRTARCKAFQVSERIAPRAVPDDGGDGVDGSDDRQPAGPGARRVCVSTPGEEEGSSQDEDGGAHRA